jgi:hypothetical protein
MDSKVIWLSIRQSSDSLSECIESILAKLHTIRAADLLSQEPNCDIARQQHRAAIEILNNIEQRLQLAKSGSIGL